MTTRPDTVTTDVQIRLVVPGSASLPVVAAFRYEVDDPYAVHVAFRTGGPEVVEWTFARSLLSEGVSGPAGAGDVQVWPEEAETGPVVCLALSSPSGRALFEVPPGQLGRFLSRTYAAVPIGSEGSQVDVDAELALLLWSEPGV